MISESHGPETSQRSPQEQRGRWDPRKHSAEANEARAIALHRLRQADQRMQSAMSLASRYKLDSHPLFRRCHRARKAVTEVRRRDPRSMETAVRRLEKLWTRLLSEISNQGPSDKTEDPQQEADRLAAALDCVDYGETVRPRKGLGYDRARLCAMIARTHLSGTLGGTQVDTRRCTSEAVARHYKNLFVQAAGGEAVAAEFMGFDPRILRKYLTLGASSVRRWSKQLRDAEQQAREEGHPVAADWEILLHTQPSAQVASRRKRTAELKEEVLTLLTEDSELACVDLAEAVSCDVSPRTISRLLQEDVEEAELAMTKLGPSSLDELLWSRIGRRPARSNAVWVMDDAYVNIDLVRPQFDPRLGRFPLDFECLVLVPAPGGGYVTKHVDHLWAQVLIDAHSRLKLCTRFFYTPPTAWDTLTTIARAALRYGLPDVLFTDNGSNFASGLLLERLQAAGVSKVFSRPRNPRANGAAERFILDLKNRLMRDLPGGSSKRGRWMRDELWTLQQIEAEVEQRIERKRNRRVHRTLGMTPRECYTRGGGGAALTDPKRILRLLQVEHELVRAADGIHTANGRYYGACLAAVPVNALVDLYFDPFDPVNRWVMRPRPDGEGRYVGRVQRRGDTEVPDVGERWNDEMEFLQTIAGPTVERIKARNKEARREEELAQGARRAEQDLARVVDLVADALEDAPRLPPRRRSSTDLDPRYGRLW